MDSRRPNKPTSAQSSDTRSQNTRNNTFSHFMTDTNEEIASEFSETISVLSFSDTDEELVEIEKKTYPEGVYGKEEAYKDIEEIFDELENDKILDPFTRWRPKEKDDQSKGKQRTKFIPKRPLALPRRIPPPPVPVPVQRQHQHQQQQPSQPSRTELLKKSKDSRTKFTDSKVTISTSSVTPSAAQTKATSNSNSKVKVFPVRGVSSNANARNVPILNMNAYRNQNQNPGKGCTAQRKSLMVELMMEATQEEADKKRLEALQIEEQERVSRSRMGSAGDTVHGDSRPLTASSIITTFEDEELGRTSRPITGQIGVSAVQGQGELPQKDYLESVHNPAGIQKPLSPNFLETKQKLVKDPYTRAGQIELRKGMKALHSISPLVTCGNEEERVAPPQVEERYSNTHTGTGSTTTLTTPTYSSNQESKSHQLKPAAASDSHISRQEELILELARSKDDKKKSNTNANTLASIELEMDSTSKAKHDKTTFKITYKEPRWPHQVTLDKMVDRLYRVKMLILDDSQLKSLRDISSLLPSLIVLSVKDCGLTTLDGALAFPNLQKLFASDNLLTHPSQCSLLSELQELDLSGNQIDTLDGFHYLGVLNFLRTIKLYDTKVTEMKSFHLELRKLIPSIRDIFPKSKVLSCDFDFDDEEYLEEDYKLLGKTEEELKKEQDILKKTFHQTTMITNTVTPTATDMSSITSTGNTNTNTKRTKSLQNESKGSRPLPTDQDQASVSVSESVSVGSEKFENLSVKPKPVITPLSNKPSEQDYSDGDRSNSNLKHIYEYVTSAGAAGETRNIEIEGDPEDPKRHSISFGIANDNDDKEKDKNKNFDLNSISTEGNNSSYWSPALADADEFYDAETDADDNDDFLSDPDEENNKDHEIGDGNHNQ